MTDLTKKSQQNSIECQSSEIRRVENLDPSSQARNLLESCDPVGTSPVRGTKNGGNSTVLVGGNERKNKCSLIESAQSRPGHFWSFEQANDGWVVGDARRYILIDPGEFLAGKLQLMACQGTER